MKFTKSQLTIKKISYAFSICFGLLTVVSCNDYLEKDLSKKKITVLSPTNNFVSENSQITFWWDEVEGAENYNIQIVRPTFAGVIALLADTNVTSNKFAFTLPPGSYQWRIKAKNQSSETDYVTYTVSVDSTISIANQLVVLSSPKQNDTTNASLILFKWLPLYEADDYRFDIWSPSINSQLIYSENTINKAITLQLEEGTYQWRVRAQNATTNTIYSSRILVIDTTAPGMPYNLKPLNYATTPDSLVKFEWLQMADAGTPLSDSIVIAADSIFSNIIESGVTKTKSYIVELVPANYFWKVCSKDAAGNYSPFTSTRKVIVQ